MIKILSLYYENFNYGGQLQAWALCHVLKCHGKDSVQISFDSNPTYKKTIGLRFLVNLQRLSWSRLSSIKVEKLINKLNQLFNVNFQKKIATRRVKFIEFEKSIPHTVVYNERNISDCVEAGDIFIVGSDQVWNPDWTSSIYFLNFVPKVNLKIAYAASLGKSNISLDFLKEISQYLDDFAGISVREKEAKQVLENYLKREIDLVLDPTLLVSEKDWLDLSVSPLKEQPYIFVYLLGSNPNHKKLIKEYAKRKRLKIVYIPHVHFSYQRNDNGFADEELYAVGPREFLGLIQNATEVLTDSFHGCVFSIIFKKQFCAFKRHQDDSNINMNSRLYTLFDSLQLRDRLIMDDFSSENMIDIMSSTIDYENVERSLSVLRKQSLTYLMKTISEKTMKTCLERHI